MSDLIYDIFGFGFSYSLALAIEDIRLRDWLFILLLFPVSLWAAKQVGFTSWFAGVWKKSASGANTGARVATKVVKDPGVQFLVLWFLLLPAVIIAIFLLAPPKVEDNRGAYEKGTHWRISQADLDQNLGEARAREAFEARVLAH